MAGYEAGAPFVGLFALICEMAKPVPVTLMHWVALLPQLLFMTTYLPPMVVDPYCSQIWVSAPAGDAGTITATRPPTTNRPAAATARSVLLMVLPPCIGGACGSALLTADGRQPRAPRRPGGVTFGIVAAQ